MVALSIILLLAMVFFHILDDYNLQSSCLVNLKQKSFWKNDPVGKSKMYENDYIAALICHAFSWSFMISIPLIIYSFVMRPNNISDLLSTICIFVVVNTIYHALMDDMKANKHKVNLIQDQLFHFVQIVCTWFAFCAMIWCV